MTKINIYIIIVFALILILIALISRPQIQTEEDYATSVISIGDKNQFGVELPTGDTIKPPIKFTTISEGNLTLQTENEALIKYAIDKNYEYRKEVYFYAVDSIRQVITLGIILYFIFKFLNNR